MYEHPSCKKCSRELTGKQTTFCSEKCSKSYLKAEYRKRNRAKLNAYNSRYRKEHPDIIAAQRKRQAERKKATVGMLGLPCNRCGTYEDLHMHHVKPRQLQGEDTQSNIMILCGECHRDWHYALDKVLNNYWQGRI